MKLRNHPLMRYEALANWPPVWSRSGVDGRVGEIGILRQVNGEDGFCTRCFLVIEHDGQRYVGALLFDDAMFCHFITKFLQSYIGLAIKDIGDLDISLYGAAPSKRLRTIGCHVSLRTLSISGQPGDNSTVTGRFGPVGHTHVDHVNLALPLHSERSSTWCRLLRLHDPQCDIGSGAFQHFRGFTSHPTAGWTSCSVPAILFGLICSLKMH
ncbi:MAG TPA: hypothetical protein VFX54_22840 [Candidatus Binatia bacterium]|nr:hypothetical protein [Candidatus Binatia bacterium]